MIVWLLYRALLCAVGAYIVGAWAFALLLR